MKLPLIRRDDAVVRGLHWASSKPFVENRRGILIHRPKSIITYRAIWGAIYPIVDYWCGASANGAHKFTFLDEPPDGKLLCARCEIESVKHNVPPSEQVVGRHVHVGSVGGLRTCCTHEIVPL